MKIVDIETVKKLSRGHFFGIGAMRFFNSRIAQTAYFSESTECYYFVTSERFDDKTPRHYTVRRLTPSGAVETVGEFQQYKTGRQAHKVARQLAREGS